MHPGNSDPLDEQGFLVDTINSLESLPTWSSTAVIIAYHDSGGWYDHQMAPILRQSQTPLDALAGTSTCGSQSSKVPTSDSGSHEQARCGLGPRLPLLVISPYARRDFVDSTLTDQSSILRFIEDNWLRGERIGNGSTDTSAGSLDTMFDFGRGPANPRLFLDPTTGEPSNTAASIGPPESRDTAAGRARPVTVERSWRIGDQGFPQARMLISNRKPYMIGPRWRS